MRPLFVAVVASLVLTISAGAAPSTQSGLRGVVKQGPSVPVCAVDVPCDGLARGVTLVFRHAGRTVGRATTTDDGSYRVRLPAGRYAVRAAGGDGVAKLIPAQAVVPRGRFARVNFLLDSGVRAP